MALGIPGASSLPVQAIVVLADFPFLAGRVLSRPSPWTAEVRWAGGKVEEIDAAALREYRLCKNRAVQQSFTKDGKIAAHPCTLGENDA